jgi:hypothetical protein
MNDSTQCADTNIPSFNHKGNGGREEAKAQRRDVGASPTPTQAPPETNSASKRTAAITRQSLE